MAKDTFVAKVQRMSDAELDQALISHANDNLLAQNIILQEKTARAIRKPHKLLWVATIAAVLGVALSAWPVVKDILQSPPGDRAVSHDGKK